MQKIRIAQVHSCDYGGGAEAVVRLHHEEMVRQGYNSRVHVARKRGKDSGITEIEYVRGPIGLRRMARWLESISGQQNIYAPSFRRLMRNLPQQADIVHLHSLHGAESYADLSQLAWLSSRISVVVTLHDLWLLTGHCAYPLECNRWLKGCGVCPDLDRYPSVPRDGTAANWRRKRRALQDARIQLIVPSQWVADQVVRSPILSHLPVAVLGNPVDTTVFFPADQSAARNTLGLPQNKKIVLITAQMLNNVYKGVQLGIDAINLQEDPDLFVVAIGRDSESVIKKCRAPGLGVDYQSEQSALADYYRAADVFLMPSRCETFGMVAAEAMACGTPVIAFASGGLPDVLGDEEGGLLVPEGSIAGLAECLRLLLSDDSRRASIADSGVRRVVREFSLPIHTQKCLNIYESVVSTN